MQGQSADQRRHSQRIAAARWATSENQQVEFAGRRWPDYVVHAACLGLALLARSFAAHLTQQWWSPHQILLKLNPDNTSLRTPGAAVH